MPQAADELILQWDELATYDGPDGTVPVSRPLIYHVRVGKTWAQAKTIACTPCTKICTKHWHVGTNTYWVAARIPGDLDVWTKPVSIDVTMTHPQSHAATGSQDAKSGGWTGTKTNCSVLSDPTSKFHQGLVLNASQLSGSYESGQIDLGRETDHRIDIYVQAEFEKAGLTWNGLAWTDVVGTWNDVRDNQASIGDYPFQRWDQFSWDSAWAQETDWCGDGFYNSTASVLVEFTVYNTDGAPGTYVRHTPGVYYGRYLKYKVTFTRASATNDTIGLTGLKVSYSDAKGVDGSDVVTGQVPLSRGGTNADLSAGAAFAVPRMNAGQTAISFSGVYIDAANQVGIGAIPTKPLDVTGDIRTSTGAFYTGTGAYAGFFKDGASAQNVKTASLVCSTTYADAAPTNGIYALGNIQTDGNIVVAGTVDGVDVAGHVTATQDVHGISSPASIAGINAGIAAANFLTVDGSGYVDDSGYTHTDFAAAVHTHDLDDIADVNAPAPSADQVLAWDNGAGEWIAKTFTGGVTDHGALSGLADDDHTQYHTDARGDARYYTQGQVDSAIDTDIATHAALTITHGVIGAIADRSGTFVNGNVLVGTGTNQIGDGGTALTALALDVDLTNHTGDGTIHFTEASIDHGSIAGLADDDHTQYHTDARGDARYYTKTLLDAGQLDTRYYTEGEVDTALGLKADDADLTAHTGASTNVHGLGVGIAVAGAEGTLTNGNLAAFNANGSLVDSTWAPSDFAETVHNHEMADVSSGVLPVDQGGLGVDVSTVTVGNFIQMAAGQTEFEDAGVGASDFESAGAVSTHAALSTGVHGVGAGTVAGRSGALVAGNVLIGAASNLIADSGVVLGDLATDAEVASAVSTHAALSTGVHGVTGSVCGTGNTQTLTATTLDGGGTGTCKIAGTIDCSTGVGILSQPLLYLPAAYGFKVTNLAVGYNGPIFNPQGSWTTTPFLNIPLFTATRTMGLLEQDQVWSGLNSFTQNKIRLADSGGTKFGLLNYAGGTYGGTIEFDDVGATSATRHPLYRDLAQTISVSHEWTSGPKIKTAGSYAATIQNASLAAASVYTIPDAGTAASFVMTAGDQSLAGAKTFSGTVILPSSSATTDNAIWIEDDGGGAPIIKVYYDGSEYTFSPV